MVKSSTTSFRLDEPFLTFLERLSVEHDITKTNVIRQSVLIVGALFAEAHRQALADLAALRERHGDDAELLCRLEMGSDGLPVASVVIDGQPVEDVVARPFADRDASVAHVFLEVERERGESPNLIPFGAEWLLVPQPRMPLGELPWPPRPDVGLKIRLGDLAGLLDDRPDQVAAATV